MEDITRAMKIVHGTAVASGIKVDGYEEWLEKAVPVMQSFLQNCAMADSCGSSRQLWQGSLSASAPD